jgi:acyl-CoA synthetase (AMP-forming)/AMP-acid ligase II
MRGLVNDCMRRAIAYGIVVLGLVLSSWQRLRIHRFSKNQRQLKHRYGITADTPILPYGPTLVQSIQTAAARSGTNARFALTSGSTGEPKRILYTQRRLRWIKFTFSDMFARACWACHLKRTSLYVFSSFQPDGSLTSMLLDEKKLPPYLSTLQAPYRVQSHPAIQALLNEYGATAVRVWILTISNPGVLYSTNPSTISTFLDDIENQWAQSSKLIRDWCNDPQRFDPAVHRIARRLESRGSTARLKRVATSAAHVPLEVFAPAVEAYLCWTGGYVKPFLDRLTTRLPSPRYRLIPMYSMSTETVETLTHFHDGQTYFLPLAGGVLYEFIEEGKSDQPENVLNPDQLQPGKTYAMVVGDSYGLRRYQTGDLFHCRRKVNGLPDLAFLRRRALEYSFTGEKVTAEQLSAVFEQVRMQFPAVIAGSFLTCVPSQHPIPHYQILLISDLNNTLPGNLIASRCDELLSAMNCEYRSKRVSGRLGPVSFTRTRTAEFARQFSENWETQFKFLPLYT